jgi:hypothetical protein
LTVTELASNLPEYPVCPGKGGGGSVFAPRLIVEIGDIRRFHIRKALIAFTSMDALPYPIRAIYRSEPEHLVIFLYGQRLRWLQNLLLFI